MKKRSPNSYMFADHESLQKTPAAQKRAAFLAYCRKAIQEHENGLATLQDAAYAITGAISIPELNKDPELETIFDLAGELELPMSQGSGNSQKKWQLLISEVEALAKGL